MQDPEPAGTPALSARFSSVREQTRRIAAPLAPEDHVVQSMEDVSPTKWHLAHTTWFFETFVLGPNVEGYRPYNERFAYLFNSYYVQAGERFSRPHRGLLSRPTVDDVNAYRAHVDSAMMAFLRKLPAGTAPEVERVVEIGLNHEQQHQELMVTDIKHVLSINPLQPAYDPSGKRMPSDDLPTTWMAFNPGIVTIGDAGSGRFCFDNEGPRHRVFVEPFELASRPVTNREYLAFVEDDAYANPVLWLSEGWATVAREGWTHPLYWQHENGEWTEFTTAGRLPLDLDAPVTHVSLFEADAFARWSGARLPTEFEWEHAAGSAIGNTNITGHFSEDLIFIPSLSGERSLIGPFHNLFGSTWEWTSSHYSPYPGYETEDGALGEYNGKFMYNQFVLRGGSVATPGDHIRLTYRNFFPGHARWQFSGIRLARSAR
ncbi:MAG: ergothioneine biosynthesis protein EgtB [Rhodothermales bacterium]